MHPTILHGHAAAELRVARLINFSHAASAQQNFGYCSGNDTIDKQKTLAGLPIAN
jgi:hypothetical protein